MVNRFVLPRLPRATLGALVTMAVLTVGAQNTHAQSNWNGGTGDWNVSTNWTPNGVPNSTSTDVSITGTSSIPSSVTLDNLTAEVHNLSLDSFSTLSISAGQELYVAGPSLSNAGQINVGVVGNPGYLALDSSTVTLSGGGIVSLNNPASQLVGFGGTETLVNKDNTIRDRAPSPPWPRSRTRGRSSPTCRAEPFLSTVSRTPPIAARFRPAAAVRCW